MGMRMGDTVFLPAGEKLRRKDHQIVFMEPGGSEFTASILSYLDGLHPTFATPGGVAVWKDGKLTISYSDPKIKPLEIVGLTFVEIRE